MSPSAPGTGPGIAELLGRHPRDSPPHGAAGAAVLILLRDGASDVEVLLIERAVSPDDLASGQVGLPGGHVEESDGALAATALREFEEEVGLGGADLTAPPRFVSIEEARVFSLKVGIFAAELGPRGRSPTVRSPKEVAHVFWLPRSALWGGRRVRRDTPRGTVEVDAVLFEGHVLWGFTRRILLDFFQVTPTVEGAGPRDPPAPALSQETA